MIIVKTEELLKITLSLANQKSTIICRTNTILLNMLESIVYTKNLSVYDPAESMKRYNFQQDIVKNAQILIVLFETMYKSKIIGKKKFVSTKKLCEEIIELVVKWGESDFKNSM